MSRIVWPLSLCSSDCSNLHETLMVSWLFYMGRKRDDVAV